MAHFFPNFQRWLGQLEDTRDQSRIVYPRQSLSWMALLLFLLKLGSRRQARFELDSPEARENLNRLAGCRLETLAHGDTLNHFLGHVPLDQYPRLRRQMVQRLIRMKALDAGRLFGHFLVVVDGTGQFYFPQRHCPQCLEKTVHGRQQYYHHVLEAKLVTPEGLAVSIGSQFIENSDPKDSKQDCELKAFYRLAPQLKKDFPQLPLGLCLDALYANGNVLSLCRQHHWKYLITFKPGSLPAVWKDYQALLELSPENRFTRAATAKGPRQEFAWVEDLEYQDDQQRTQRFNAFQCREHRGQESTLFAWITNFPLRRENVAALSNRGGRCRWKIENEGFNIQKNGGFNLEHVYSAHDRQSKNFYVLMQIAHLILQLLERGSLLSRDAKTLFGSLRNLARRLAESIRNCLIPPDALDSAAAARFQIRLNSS